MGNGELESIERKLNVILKLLTRSLLPKASQKDRIAFLSSLALSANEMAEIVGTTPSALSRLNYWVESLEFDPSIRGSESPVNR